MERITRLGGQTARYVWEGKEKKETCGGERETGKVKMLCVGEWIGVTAKKGKIKAAKLYENTHKKLHF